MSWLSGKLDSIGLGGVNDAFASITPWNDANPFGAPQALSQDFNYDPATATATTSAGQDMGFLNQAMNNMGGQAGLMNQTAGQMGGVSDALMGAGQNFLNQSQSFADGSNPMYARMRQNMIGDISSQATMGARQGAEALAGMGAGSKGMRDIVAGKLMNTAMSNVGQNYESMLDQGLGLATTYGGMGMQGMQGAGNLLNMAGGLQQGAGGLYQGAGNLGMAGASLGQANNQFNASQANQMSMFNADAQNQATQFGLSGNYQSAFNRQGRSDNFLNQFLNPFGNALGTRYGRGQ